MNLYLDDDCISRALIGALRKAGRDLMLPADIGLSGAEDAVHLRRAILEQRAFLSRNYLDFKNLHDLVLTAGGHHPGILVVRKDKNPKHNLTMSGIVLAIGKLLAAGAPVVDEYTVLNHWR
jgi:hypothetical protein